MLITKTDFPDLLILQPKILEDDRGYFFESYNKKMLADHGIHLNFVQDNEASSSYGIVRGLHFQLNPYAQTKLVRVISGRVIDSVVDLRQNSPTFGKAFSIELSAENKKQLLVPRGFAHGYSVISESAVVAYKCDEFYNKESEGGVLWSDPALQIDWRIPLDSAVVSEKDKKQPLLKDCQTNFIFNGN